MAVKNLVQKKYYIPPEQERFVEETKRKLGVKSESAALRFILKDWKAITGGKVGLFAENNK